MHALATDRGPREHNEDRAVCVCLQQASGAAATILCVCDGVGGSAHGEVAATLGAAEVAASMTAYSIGANGSGEMLQPDEVLAALVESLTRANARILEESQHQPELRGMASTIVAAVFIGRLLLLAWVGDSRAYLFREGELRRLTVDHSETQRLLEAGLLTTEQAETSPFRHCIYRHLGQREGFEVDTRMLRLLDDDQVLLCSDGLSDALTDSMIAEVLATSVVPPEAVDRLIRAALEHNPTDNTTVALYHHEPELVLTSRTLTRGFTGAFAHACAQPQGDRHE